MTPDQLRAEADRLTAEATALETKQLARADLAGMSPEEIVTAKTTGRLNTLLGLAPTKEI